MTMRPNQGLSTMQALVKDKPVGAIHLTWYGEKSEPLCGAKIKSQQIRCTAPDGQRDLCHNCRTKYMKKYQSVLKSSTYMDIVRHEVESVRVFVFVEEAPYVKQINFQELSKGNVYYTELSNGDLECNDQGEFLFCAASNPECVAVDTNFKPVNWSIRTQSLVNYINDTMKSLSAIKKVINFHE